MLTRFVRTQLIIFTVASVIGVVVMAFVYMQVPTLLGLGRITVKLELPASGGLYRFSNVTYRGVQIGKVTDVDVIGDNHVEATLSLNTSPPVPTNLVAQVRSISAVGEQYVDLQPHDESPPYLQNGSVIPASAATIPQQVGPMLDQASALVNSIPKDKLGSLLEESFKAFNGAGYDFGSLLESSSTLAHDANGVADQTQAVVNDSGPLLDAQAQTTDALKVWTHSLADITNQVNRSDPQVRTLLQEGPGFADETSRLLNEVKPTLPVLLANLTSIGQVLVTYHPALEQLLVLFPPNTATIQAVSPRNNATGLPLGDFTLTIADPPTCTVGFLPPSSWRSPADTTEVDTPDGLYCKLPQDAPMAVRGARNYPCMEHPGKRAPTVQLCDDPTGFVPLAQRQHILGPYPTDPNLISQGIPPDRRIDPSAGLYGPVDGTPLPPGAGPPVPAAPAPVPGDATGPPAPPDSPPPPAPADPGVPAAPSSFQSGAPGSGPSVALAQYNPRTGVYMASDGDVYRQSDLVGPVKPKAWTDMMLGVQ
jgi:phospholipid/cholesterol/gamma-HCH transport system substrate-binding protein